MWKPTISSATPATPLLLWYRSEQATSGVVLFSVAALAFAGAALVSGGSPDAPGKHAVRILRKNLSQKSSTVYKMSLLLAALAITMSIVGVGVATLMSSDRYLSISGSPTLATLGAALLLPCVAGLGMCLGCSSPAWAKAMAVAFLTIVVLFLFSRASRALGIVPCAAMLGYLTMSAKASRNRLIKISITILPIAWLLVGVSLTARMSDRGHGFFPYADFLRENYALVPHSMGQSFDNILFTLPLSSFVRAEAPPIDINDLLISLNPLPGGMAGWGELSPSLRVHQFIPYSALGELGNFGLVFVAAYSFLCGLIFNMSGRAATLLPAALKEFSSLIQYALLGMFFVQSLQYNLRSCTRYPYYAIVFTATIILVSKIRIALPASDAPPDTPRHPTLAS